MHFFALSFLFVPHHYNTTFNLSSTFWGIFQGLKNPHIHLSWLDFLAFKIYDIVCLLLPYLLWTRQANIFKISQPCIFDVRQWQVLYQCKNSKTCPKLPVNGWCKMTWEGRWLPTTSQITIKLNTESIAQYWPLKAVGCLIEVTTNIGLTLPAHSASSFNKCHLIIVHHTLYLSPSLYLSYSPCLSPSPTVPSQLPLPLSWISHTLFSSLHPSRGLHTCWSTIFLWVSWPKLTATSPWLCNNQAWGNSHIPAYTGHTHSVARFTRDATLPSYDCDISHCQDTQDRLYMSTEHLLPI